MRENFDEDNSFFIVFDLVSGREMFEELCFDGPYSEADAARHIREATAGLAFMHGLGIIHADLKPEVSEVLSIVVVDWIIRNIFCSLLRM